MKGVHHFENLPLKNSVSLSLSKAGILMYPGFSRFGGITLTFF